MAVSLFFQERAPKELTKKLTWESSHETACQNTGQVSPNVEALQARMNANTHFAEMIAQMTVTQSEWDLLMAEQEDRPLTWNDLSKDDIRRFQMEDAGRSYAANPSLDRILEPLRRVYEDYRKKAEQEAKEKDPDAHLWWWDGVPSDPTWPSSVMLSELQAANKMADKW